jgi:hypothetical protein
MQEYIHRAYHGLNQENVVGSYPKNLFFYSSRLNYDTSDVNGINIGSMIFTTKKWFTWVGVYPEVYIHCCYSTKLKDRIQFRAFSYILQNEWERNFTDISKLSIQIPTVKLPEKKNKFLTKMIGICNLENI